MSRLHFSGVQRSYGMQAVKCDVANLEQLLSRLTQRMEAHDQQNLERSQQLADLTQKQWIECRSAGHLLYDVCGDMYNHADSSRQH